MSARPPLPPTHPSEDSMIVPSEERLAVAEHPLSQTAFICGEVDYRTGDGPLMRIRPGQVHVEINEIDVTLGWEDGDARLSAVMPRSEYARFIAIGAIKPVVTHKPDAGGDAGDADGDADGASGASGGASAH